jgi:hypothetical protein
MRAGPKSEAAEAVGSSGAVGHDDCSLYEDVPPQNRHRWSLDTSVELGSWACHRMSCAAAFDRSLKRTPHLLKDLADAKSTVNYARSKTCRDPRTWMFVLLL